MWLTAFDDSISEFRSKPCVEGNFDNEQKSQVDMHNAIKLILKIRQFKSQLKQQFAKHENSTRTLLITLKPQVQNITKTIHIYKNFNRIANLSCGIRIMIFC